MNRKQRRAKERIHMVDLRQVALPQTMNVDECRLVALYRMGLNVTQTGNAFHHLTANNVIVDADPTLEYCLSRLTEDERDSLRSRYGKANPHAPKAVRVNRKYYGHDPYQNHC